MVPKLYFIASEGHGKQVSCLILSNGAWYAKYTDSYITIDGRKRVVKRFEDAMRGRGYTRAKSMKIPDEYRK